MSIKSFPVIDLVATGKNIVRLRRESGLSVADLQEYFGFEAPQAIYKWQKGQSLPSTDNLLALGHLLDVTMEEILVTRPTISDHMPQEESCGSHRFGDVILLWLRQFHSSVAEKILIQFQAEIRYLMAMRIIPGKNRFQLIQGSQAVQDSVIDDRSLMTAVAVLIVQGDHIPVRLPINSVPV